jgi:hypothetical protein
MALYLPIQHSHQKKIYADELPGALGIDFAATDHALSHEMILVGDGSPEDHWGGTKQSQGEELSKDEGNLNTVHGVGKTRCRDRVADGSFKRNRHETRRSGKICIVNLLSKAILASRRLLRLRMIHDRKEP